MHDEVLEELVEVVEVDGPPPALPAPMARSEAMSTPAVFTVPE